MNTQRVFQTMLDRMRLTRRKRRIVRRKIEQISPRLAELALERYKFFLSLVELGCRRPCIADDRGVMIAPICPALVPVLERVAHMSINECASGWSKEAKRCSYGKRRRLFEEAANALFDRHRAEQQVAA